MDDQSRNQGLYDPVMEHDACGIGAVVNISGEQNHSIIKYAREILVNLEHRGGAGADENTGDGGGILFQIPHEFFVNESEKLNFDLPEANKYGVGMVFGVKDDSIRDGCEKLMEEAIVFYDMDVLGWRDVPTSSSCLGKIAVSCEPSIRQVFVSRGSLTETQFELKLYLARKRAEQLVLLRYANHSKEFYIVSLSSRTICYKGMFLAWQLFEYYPDLQDESVKSAIAVVHQRYSTNTFPSWKLAHPFRCIAHNGEINTINGNRIHMQARETTMSSSVFGEHIEDIMPILSPEMSDSACFDTTLELLVRSGRSMPHSMMMMMPEAFGSKYHISTDKRAFYEYHSTIMEPWDGPAAVVFTDGRILGATIDRNGLRPCRYVVTTDGLAILASEAGVVDMPSYKIQKKGCLGPGKMFLVNTVEKRIISDNEIKSKIARQRPYRRWLEDNKIELRGLFDSPTITQTDANKTKQMLKAFGYTNEDLKTILVPMAVNGQEPIGSMGDDSPTAVFSDKPKLLFNYFKQRFAQVTNPPIDPIREGVVMSLVMFAGKKGNLLDETPQHCKQLKLPHPVLTKDDLERLRSVTRDDFKVTTISSLFDVDKKDPGFSLKNALDQLANNAEKAVKEGATIIVISDSGISKTKMPIPSLLATAVVHSSLLDRGLRDEVGLIVESGEPREVTHFCLLCGYGANAVYPYLAFETLLYMRDQKMISQEMELTKIGDHYIAAVKKGILKTMSKMGISTLRSYRSAKLFEAIGLKRPFVDKYFAGAGSRISGIGLDEIAQESVERHLSAFGPEDLESIELDIGGEYRYKKSGERHLWNPDTIALLRKAVTTSDAKAYAEYANAVNDQTKTLYTLRGLFEFVKKESISIDDVEPVEEIVKRFCTGAMSHGSISKETHDCMSIAMNRLGGMSNTGEGGEDPVRYLSEGNHNLKNCAIKQVASGRFGVTINYLAHAKEIQIKMAQGAKPGEGGQLPGHKVTEEIAHLRYSIPGVTLISPAPHHDIYSIEDMAQLIYDLKCSNPDAKVSVKLVSEFGVGTIAAGVVKANADEILISGSGGGTGASPLSSIKHTGTSWELGLAETQQVLLMNGLRSRVKIQVDGNMMTGRDVVIAALLGGERFGFGTAALVALKCALLRKCHEGTCTFGIGTQDPKLRNKFSGKPEYIERFMLFVAEEVRSIMAELGYSKFDDMVGKVERLRTRTDIDHWKAKKLNLSSILYLPFIEDKSQIRKTCDQPDKLKNHLDWTIIEKVMPTVEKNEKIKIELPIRNIDRTVGTILSNNIIMKFGEMGLPDGTIEVTLNGSAGQSFGAFLAPGVTLRLVGDCNDFLGKGLSGGRIIVKTPDDSPFLAHENIIAGKTLLYGATSGEVFINGISGERFAVRNSGATAVVEGVGDHGCEYMAGGVVVILGHTGYNFGAGMTGGVAYVLDEMQLFDTRCNLDLVELESVWHGSDQKILYNLIKRHFEWTKSRRAEYILESWQDMVGKFVKVIPADYRKAIENIREGETPSADSMTATEEVFCQI